jgi:hypothetical protein
MVSFMVFLPYFPLSSSSVDCNAIHINGEPALGYLFAEYCVHYHLKGSGGIGELKEHYGRFEEALWCKEGSLPFVPWLNLNVVVSPANIKLGEKGAAAEAIDGLGN